MPRISNTTLMINRITAGFWLIPRIKLAMAVEAPSFTSTYVNRVEVPMINSVLAEVMADSSRQCLKVFQSMVR